VTRIKGDHIQFQNDKSGKWIVVGDCLDGIDGIMLSIVYQDVHVDLERMNGSRKTA